MALDQTQDDSYADALLAEAEGQAKGQRTRALILSETCRLLDETTPDALKVGDLCRAAGVSNGTFYLYFDDRDALLSALLAGFVAYLHAGLLDSGAEQDALHAATARYVHLFRRNKGLMRCLVHHHDQLPQARAACTIAFLPACIAAFDRVRGSTSPPPSPSPPGSGRLSRVRAGALRLRTV